MKINIVTGFFLPVPPVCGGSTEKVWHRLSQAFATAGHDVTFISRRWPGFADCETLGGVKHVRLRGATHTSSLPLNLWRDFRWGWRVTRALPPAEVTICNTVLLPIWLRRFRPSAGRVVAVLSRMPKGHGRFYGNVDLLLSLSDAVTEALLRENPRLAGRIAAFPYPIDYVQQERGGMARDNLPRSTATIGYIGRVHPEKGLSLLLRAAARLATRRDLPRWQVMIGGPAAVSQGGGGESYVAQLQSEFGALLGHHLIFKGPEFDPVRLAARYGELEIFCYPSIAESGETFGVAVAEAMAARCAPVVSRLACFQGLIESGQTGFTFDHNAPDADKQLADILARLLLDNTLRGAIAAHAQAHVRRFDFGAVSDHLLKNLHELVASR